MNRAEAIKFAKSQRDIFGGRMGEFLEFVENELTQTNTPNTLNALDCVDTISRQAAIDNYIMKCPYFAGKNTIDRSSIGTHIGSCNLEHHYRKVCPSNECLCAERMGLKNG